MSQDSKPSRRNSEPAHPSVSDDERWKTHPSEETSGDSGHNARVEQTRKIEENAPLLQPNPPPRRS